MKYSFVTLSALAAAVMAAPPSFLNSGFDVQENVPFTLSFSGCDSGCTITLQNGESTNTKDVETLSSSATGGSFTFTPSGLPSDTYNFKIKDNSSGEQNYSSQFKYTGTGSLPSSTVTGTMTATVTKATTEVSTKSATVSASGSTSVSVTTVSHASTFTTVSTGLTSTTLTRSTNGTATETTVKKPTSTETETGVKTSSKASPTASASATTVPNSGAAHLTSSLALVAGAVMAMVYLN